jgi:dihydropteroate synthase
MAERSRFTWNLGGGTLSLGKRTLVMGVVNVTPDSFSDGGQFLDPDKAIRHGLQLLDEGADILDIGGESTRPGASVAPGEPAGTKRLPVSAEEELSRVLPVIEGLRKRRPDAVLSVDTYKAEVAQRAVVAGAEIVNDVSGLRWDAGMAAALAGLECGVVLMHTRGVPEHWRTQPPPEDIVAEVVKDLAESVDWARGAGIARDRIVLDPGFGFGKNFEENYPLLAHLDRLARLGFPLMSGPSRKSFLGRTAGHRTTGGDLRPDQRLNATLAAVTASVLKGAHIVRVHDVQAAVEAVAVADAILAAE